jgi:hypothetical protein
MLLLAALRAYGPERTADYLPPPKWARPSRRPSCLELISLLRNASDNADVNGDDNSVQFYSSCG